MPYRHTGAPPIVGIMILEALRRAVRLCAQQAVTSVVEGAVRESEGFTSSLPPGSLVGHGDNSVIEPMPESLSASEGNYRCDVSAGGERN